MDKIDFAKILAFLKKNRFKLIIALGMLIYAIGAMLSGSLSPEEGMRYMMQSIASLFSGSGELPPPGMGV